MDNLLRIFTCTALLASAAVVGAQVGGKHSTLPGTVPQAKSQGETLYRQKGCYQCHGLVGQGAVGVGSVLHPGRLDAAGFAAYVRGPSGQMPPYSAKLVSDVELGAIHAWLSGLARAPSAGEIQLLKRFAPSNTARAREGNAQGDRAPLGSITSSPPPAPVIADANGPGTVRSKMSATPVSTAALSAGAVTYRQACAACHGAALEGGAGPALAGIVGQRTAAQLADAVRNPPGAMPKLHPDPVSEQDLKSLVAFLRASGGKTNATTRRSAPRTGE